MMNLSNINLSNIMKKPEKIRNLSVIAHVDHGKSTLTDSLFAGTGAIRMDQAGSRRVTDNRLDESERCITIKSTGVSFYFPANSVRDETLINLIDSPGHVDFSSEVTAALRATDGAFVVVDSVEGVCVQTETVLRQALQERIKPVLIINKLDRLFMELQCDLEEIYQRLTRVIESVNVILATYQDETMGDYSVCPLNGTVCFAAGIMGWAFTLKQFSKFYANKLNVDSSKLLKSLWGDRFISKQTSKWKSTVPSNLISHDCEWIRGFCEYILKPIKSIFDAALENSTTNWESLDKVLQTINITLTSNQRELTRKELIKTIIQKWFPAHEALLELAIEHLPSPITAQKYRVDTLYNGPLDDSTAESIRNCDPNGPLVIYISKMAPERPNDPDSRFLAFGRVFSGTVSAGKQVRILGSNFEYGKKIDLFEKVTIPRVCCLVPKLLSIEEVPAGNTVAITGIEKYISKNGTICSDPNSYPLKNMIYAVAPVVKRAVEPSNPKEIPKLVQALTQLANSDNLVVCTIDATSGEFIVAGAGELHLEICLGDLQKFMGESKIIIRDPIVSYCETVIEESSKPQLSKSPNLHNRLFGIASPLESELIRDIMKGDFECGTSPKVSKELQNKYQWDGDIAKGLWSFSPNDGNKSNVLINATRGIQYMNEIKDSCVTACEWVSKQGVLAEEPMQGIKFSITDSMLHADTIHRAGNQMIPTARKLFYACQLSASPRLLEPVYLVEITCPRPALKGCYNSILKRRGTILDEIAREKTNLVLLKAYLPVAESFGFDSALRAETGGQAFPMMIFDHWQLVEGDPLVEGTIANKIVKEIRIRKGLSPTLPCLSDYASTL